MGTLRLVGQTPWGWLSERLEAPLPDLREARSDEPPGQPARWNQGVRDDSPHSPPCPRPWRPLGHRGPMTPWSRLHLLPYVENQTMALDPASGGTTQEVMTEESWLQEQETQLAGVGPRHPCRRAHG